MKIKLIIFSFLLFFLNNLYSQSEQGIVQYGQLESMGMSGPVGVDYNSILIFNKNEALYITRKDSLELAHINKMITVNKSDQTVARLTKSTNEKGFLYYQNKDSLYCRDLGFTYVKAPLPKINWDLKNETKKIGNLVVKKANAHFRGRNYTAWYTTSIPLPYGPWKLHGLPGLILEAYDENKEIYFYFKSITYPSKTKRNIQKPKPPKDKKWISFPEYKAFLSEAYKDAIYSGRMALESADIDNRRGGKSKMGDTYIEDFLE